MSNETKPGAKNYSSLEATQDDPLSAKPNTTSSKSKTIFYALIIVTLLLVGLVIFTIVYVVDKESDSSSSSNRGKNVCETEECVELSSNVLSWMNQSVDPCEDFFQYSCGGFQELYGYQLSKYGQWTTEWSNLAWMGVERQKMIFDTLFDENDELNNHASFIAMKSFYLSCYDSTVEEEDIASTELLKTFTSMVNITQTNHGIIDLDLEWNTDINNRFTDAMAWLSLRNWNDLYEIDVYDVGMSIMLQNWNQFIDFNRTIWEDNMEVTYIPLYQSLFGLSLNDSELMAGLVIDFAESVSAITVYEDYYDNEMEVMDNLVSIDFDEFVNSNVFGANAIQNYSAILLDTFNAGMSDMSNVWYLPDDIPFYENLTDLVSATAPMIVQYWLFTDVLSHYFDYDDLDAFSQPRTEDRRQFCYDLMKNEFAFFYGHIVVTKQYSLEKQQMAQDLVDNIIENGLYPLLEDAKWIDDESKQEMLKKAEYMKTYVGVPDNIRNISLMDEYYGILEFDLDDNFVNNYDVLLQFDSTNKLNAFYDLGDANDVTFAGPWPDMFNIPSRAPSWLTGISAFYSGSGNYFAIPALITQKVFFDANYPSSMNYGAIGFVIGHEISHGFDPWGSLYSFNGTQVDTWTNATRDKYNERIDCYINEYNNIEVNDGVFINGSETIGENTADNAGLEEAWTAWKYYERRQMDDNDNEWDFVELPGFDDFDNDQLFWIAMAQTRCDVWKDDYYVNPNSYYRSHSARMARVIGVVQNQIGFADAFKCQKNTPMNPDDKCHLWIDY